MNQVIKQIQILNTNALTADGFDEAIFGIGMRNNQWVVIYNADKCIEILMKDMSEEEAVEHFEFNVTGAWCGDHTPMFVYSAGW